MTLRARFDDTSELRTPAGGGGSGRVKVIPSTVAAEKLVDTDGKYFIADCGDDAFVGADAKVLLIDNAGNVKAAAYNEGVDVRGRTAKIKVKPAASFSIDGGSTNADVIVNCPVADFGGDGGKLVLSVKGVHEENQIEVKDEDGDYYVMNSRGDGYLVVELPFIVEDV